MFSIVLGNYPSFDPCDAKGNDGGVLFSNQCAIRLSFALRKSGVNFDAFPKARKCWVHPNEQEVLAAKELADWLQQKKVPFIINTETVTGTEWRKKVVSRTGIICFEDYYTAGAGGGGDHIDMCDGSSLTGLGSWMRTRFGIVVPGLWSDFRKSKRIRFFPFA